MMSPEKFAKEMRAIQEKHVDDIEDIHAIMDGLLCEVLRDLGYGEGVDVFAAQEKWYA